MVPWRYNSVRSLATLLPDRKLLEERKVGCE
jgi:hypothetical protein